MALIQRAPSRKKQIQLGLMLTAIIGTTLAVAYFGLLRKPSFEASGGLGPINLLEDTTKIPERTSGLDALQELQESAQYDALQEFGTFPIQTSPRGKQQPFILPSQ